MLEASQLAMANLNLHLIEKVPHFFHRDLVLNGELLGDGAGNLTFPGGLFKLGDYLFIFQRQILLSPGIK